MWCLGTWFSGGLVVLGDGWTPGDAFLAPPPPFAAVGGVAHKVGACGVAGLDPWGAGLLNAEVDGSSLIGVPKLGVTGENVFEEDE